MIVSHPRILILALAFIAIAGMIGAAFLADALIKRTRRAAHRGPKKLRTNIRRPAADLPSILKRQAH